MAEGACDPAQRRRLSTLLWATRSLKEDYRKMQSQEHEHAARISRQDPMARQQFGRGCLATSSDASIRDGNLGQWSLAEQAVQLSERPRMPTISGSLAAAYA